MKPIIIFIGLSIAIVNVNAVTNTTISVNSRQLGETVQIIGILGRPLGQAVEIGGTIITGREVWRKEYQGAYLIKVTMVDGKPLPEPCAMPFAVHPCVRVRMASDGFGLYTLKTGKTASRLTGEQIDELEKGYVGSAVRLLAYETGAFSGIPSNLPRDFVVWQDRRFSFSTQLVILQDRSNNANTKPDASELSPARKRGAGVSEHTNVLPK